MDELKKLLENAGIQESVTGDAEDILNHLSTKYIFEVHGTEIRVFVNTDEGVVGIAKFVDFDDMLANFGKM